MTIAGIRAAMLEIPPSHRDLVDCPPVAALSTISDMVSSPTSARPSREAEVPKPVM